MTGPNAADGVERDGGERGAAEPGGIDIEPNELSDAQGTDAQGADVKRAGAEAAPADGQRPDDEAAPADGAIATGATAAADPATHPAASGAPAATTTAAAAEPTPAPRSALPQPVLGLLGVFLGIAILVALPQAGAFIGPVFLGINLVIAVIPLESWLRSRGVPGWGAAIICGLTVYAFLILCFWSLGWSISELIRVLPDYADQFDDLYGQFVTWLASFGITPDQVVTQAQNALNPSTIASTLTSLASNLGSVLGLLSTLAVVLFFLFFDAIGMPKRIDRLGQLRPNLHRAFVSFAGGVQRYWVVTTAFGLLVAVLDVIGLELLGVPLALVWGVFAFVTNYIPNIGFVIGLIPPTLMALLANGPLNALIVLILFSVINFVMQSIIQPKVAGDAVGVTPTVSFLSLLVWASALGPLGALLALPATLLVKALIVDANPRAAWVNQFIASKPDDVEDPEHLSADPAANDPVANASAPNDRIGSADPPARAATD